MGVENGLTSHSGGEVLRRDWGLQPRGRRGKQIIKSLCLRHALTAQLPHPAGLLISGLGGDGENCSMHFISLSFWGSLSQQLCISLTNGGDLVTKSCPTLVIPWNIACQAPLSMGFSRQEYWSRLPFSSPGNLPNSEIDCTSSVLAGGLLHCWQILNRWGTR